jgi:hypothetical protein
VAPIFFAENNIEMFSLRKGGRACGRRRGCQISVSTATMRGLKSLAQGARILLAQICYAVLLISMCREGGRRNHKKTADSRHNSHVFE